MQAQSNDKPRGCVSALDQERLESLIEKTFGEKRALNPFARTVLHRLRNAGVIVGPDLIPPCLVTMNSTVRLVDDASGREWEVILSYPEDHDPAESCWSVLGPVGAAIFGLTVGESVDIPDEAGVLTRWRVAAIPFQPEARGFLTM